MRGPHLIIVPSLQKAESLLEDLHFFSQETNDAFVLYPPWETLPYDEIPPHPEIIRDRVRCLFSLLHEEEVMIISPVQALMQKVLPPTDLKGSTLSLQVGEEIVREGLLRYLQDNGYTSARVVEERGDYSLRGAIIDIFSPSHEEPLRLEFDGDRLASLRRFEPENQRSLPGSELERAILLPARDLSKNLFEQPLGSFFDYLKGEGVVFIEEMEEVGKEAKSFSRSIDEHYEKALTKKRPVLPPGLLYFKDEELFPSMKRFKNVFLQEGPLAPLPCEDVFAFETETNEDLRREMNALFATGKGSAEASPFSILLRQVLRWRERG
ncbi:MAG TPA: hypothetical protein VLK23_20345, partial [Thermodesulfobacteriota bacterium]|nr:hypothetical protein [Thermodesulfobacteriota bacterium]